MLQVQTPMVRYIAPVKVTRDRANEILTLHKLGLERYPAEIVSLALMATGDLQPKRQKVEIQA